MFQLNKCKLKRKIYNNHTTNQKGVILKFTGWCHKSGEIVFQLWRPKVRYHTVSFRLISEFKLEVMNYPNICQVRFSLIK